MRSNPKTWTRFAIAVLCLAGVYGWVYLKWQDRDDTTFVFVTIALVGYLLVSYLLRPKPRRYGRARLKRTNKDLQFLRFVLAPGALLAIALIDGVALLFGKRIDHERYRWKVTP